jgi:Caspase domain
MEDVVKVDVVKVEAAQHRSSGEPAGQVRAPRARMRTEELCPATSADGPSSRFRRSLAVVIGIDTYGEGISPLRSAAADAKAIAEALRRDHGFETWCLLDDDALLPHLLTLLREELPGALGPEDRLLFYFAGHGIAMDGCYVARPVAVKTAARCTAVGRS